MAAPSRGESRPTAAAQTVIGSIRSMRLVSKASPIGTATTLKAPLTVEVLTAWSSTQAPTCHQPRKTFSFMRSPRPDAARLGLYSDLARRPALSPANRPKTDPTMRPAPPR